MADLDGDGRPDLISGSWPGEIYLFRGKGKGEFAPPEKLRFANGKTINIGGGLQKGWGDGEFVVSGDARFENTDSGQVIVYDGERYEVPPGKQAGISGTASAVHVADWDDDGDLDLLVGNIWGDVYLVPNEGTAKAWSFGKERLLRAGGGDIKVSGDAGPFVVDWDGDGLPDLLVGGSDGSVSFFRNVGTRKAPDLAAAVILVPPGETHYGKDAPKEPCRGSRSKICAADWNGDGRLDLLLGDIEYLKPDLPEPTPEQKVEQAKLRKELEEVRQRYDSIREKLGTPGGLKDGAEREKAEKEAGEARRRLGEIGGKLPRESENHGFVWLFLRRPASGEKAAR